MSQIKSNLRKMASKSLHLKLTQQNRYRQDSGGDVEELIQCGICLEKLTDPRMLPCQHTFCLSCLQSHLNANRVLIKQDSCIKCPICQNKLELENGSESLKNLPKNLYIDSMLKLVEGKFSPNPIEKKCAKCGTVALEEQQGCQHCMQFYCNVCWNLHLEELESNLPILKKQLDESRTKLDYKMESFENRCQRLSENIKVAAAHKIELIKIDEENVLKDVDRVLQEGQNCQTTINTKIDEIISKISQKSSQNSTAKVCNFMNLHRETSRLLSQICHFAETRVIFDSDTFRLEQKTEGIYNEIEENEPVNPLVATHQYRNRTFVPKLVWNRCPRPANVGVPPWDSSLVYITATDTHSVLILNRDVRKLQGRLIHSEMLYPQGIAFSNKFHEIYVSDKWKHSIHVFAQNGDYSREMLLGKLRSPDGLAITPNEQLVVCDSGNDRIIIVEPQNGEHLSTIGLVSNKTTLNMPTGIAMNGDKIVVADTGNHRIKTFDLNGTKLEEFGSLGTGKGQFKSAEIVCVDSLGYILVGDGGNGRVQIFKPDGTLVKIFGGNDGFGWISGMCVTTQFDIIVADSKTRCLQIF